MRTSLKLVLLAIFALPTYIVSSAEQIRLNTVTAEKDKYQLGLLKLALSYSDTEYEFIQSSNKLTQTKMLSELKSNKLDVAWGGTSKSWEEQFSPIRVPLFKGLLGHRIFIIREGEQSRFNQVSRLADLNSFKAGQGRSWSDCQVLNDAGVPLITTLKYNNLFYMLEGGRFDYLPRSVYSPWSEIKKRAELPLEVEKNILLVYPLPAYIFVNKENTQLKNEIERGLFKAIEDGSFDDYFYSHPLILEGLTKSKVENRTIFRLANKSLPAETPLADKRLWFDIDKYIARKKQDANSMTATADIRY